MMSLLRKCWEIGEKWMKNGVKYQMKSKKGAPSGPLSRKPSPKRPALKGVEAAPFQRHGAVRSNPDQHLERPAPECSQGNPRQKYRAFTPVPSGLLRRGGKAQILSIFAGFWCLFMFGNFGYWEIFTSLEIIPTIREAEREGGGGRNNFESKDSRLNFSISFQGLKKELPIKISQLKGVVSLDLWCFIPFVIWLSWWTFVAKPSIEFYKGDTMILMFN